LFRSYDTVTFTATWISESYLKHSFLRTVNRCGYFLRELPITGVTSVFPNKNKLTIQPTNQLNN